MNATKYNFGRPWKLALIVGTTRLASNRGLVGEPSNPPAGIDFRFGRSPLKETRSSCRSRPKDKFLHTFRDHSRMLYLITARPDRGTRRNFGEALHAQRTGYRPIRRGDAEE